MARPAHPLLAAVAATTLAAATLVACGRVEGYTPWETAIHQQEAASGAAERRPAAGDTFPVPPPPFSPGIFPCSRCHEGGEPAKDERPAIPHALHLGRGLACADCHSPDDEEGDPKIPSREVCDTCHGDAAKLSEGARAYFAAVTKADGTTEFPKRWKSRDVRQEHVRHGKAGVECASCHGAPSDRPFEKPKPVTLMDRCTGCHEERKTSLRCESCHADTTAKAHAAIVLHHAEEQRGCLDCHDARDRDHLRLANGSPLPFSESFRLCGQCHGTQFRDWKIGLHGKRTGEWDGPKQYRLCVHCHSPHAPKFPPMAPVAKPARPEDVR